MSTEAKFDPIGRARARSRLLKLIPEPAGRAFDDAARAALIRSGFSDEEIKFLDEAAASDPSPPPRPA
jgi:hypothetical protein